jgi:hypothetical protein
VLQAGQYGTKPAGWLDMERQLHSTTPPKLNWVNRLWLSFLLDQALKAQRKADIAAQKLSRYADQLGHWDWAMACLHPNRMSSTKKPTTGLNQSINHSTTPVPTVPAAPIKTAEVSPPFLSVISDTSGSEHSKSKTSHPAISSGQGVKNADKK